MKFSMLCIFLISIFLVIDAKSRKSNSKFEGDFEFVDEDDKNSQSKQPSEKKKWIHDPSSDLCKPLNCKKKELCLLEDAFTAVCVSKKELHKNRNEIISKTKYLEAEAKRSIESDDETQNEFEEEILSSEDVFYDADDNVLEENCKPCPVVNPTFLCGSDNRTYSSVCRLDYHNCIHSTSIKMDCKGFCPCQELTDIKKRQKMSDRLNAFNIKYQRTMQQNSLKAQISQASKDNIKIPNVESDYKFTPEDVRYDNKHYKYIKYTTNKNNKKSYNSDLVTRMISLDEKHKIHGYNEVIDKTENKIQKNKNMKTECNPQQLTAIGDRLLDWFSVIMADTKKRHTRVPKMKANFPLTCKMEAKWMFGHLDIDNNGVLSGKELYDIENDKNEICIKPFIEVCDKDLDFNLEPYEWCKCFEKSNRPCAAVRKRLTGDLVGSYAPDCDVQGFYKPMQCHNSVGVCWCVDKHGVEFANTRTRGKPICDTLSNKSIDLIRNDDQESDDEDDDESLEGSADRLLVF
ncbi:proteoglycan Cow [Culicoides brevitarsis]|uniref:proteoglycan Cow n=1 Tax=Culicoides brevitarsis TaxID=469753 RepID=UPI00307BE14B